MYGETRGHREEFGHGSRIFIGDEPGALELCASSWSSGKSLPTRILSHSSTKYPKQPRGNEHSSCRFERLLMTLMQLTNRGWRQLSAALGDRASIAQDPFCPHRRSDDNHDQRPDNPVRPEYITSTTPEDQRRSAFSVSWPRTSLELEERISDEAWPRRKSGAVVTGNSTGATYTHSVSDELLCIPTPRLSGSTLIEERTVSVAPLSYITILRMALTLNSGKGPAPAPSKNAAPRAVSRRPSSTTDNATNSTTPPPRSTRGATTGSSGAAPRPPANSQEERICGQMYTGSPITPYHYPEISLSMSEATAHIPFSLGATGTTGAPGYDTSLTTEANVDFLRSRTLEREQRPTTITGEARLQAASGASTATARPEEPSDRDTPPHMEAENSRADSVQDPTPAATPSATISSIPSSSSSPESEHDSEKEDVGFRNASHLRDLILDLPNRKDTTKQALPPEYDLRVYLPDTIVLFLLPPPVSGIGGPSVMRAHAAPMSSVGGNSRFEGNTVPTMGRAFGIPKHGSPVGNGRNGGNGFPSGGSGNGGGGFPFGAPSGAGGGFPGGNPGRGFPGRGPPGPPPPPPPGSNPLFGGGVGIPCPPPGGGGPPGFPGAPGGGDPHGGFGPDPAVPDLHASQWQLTQGREYPRSYVTRRAASCQPSEHRIELIVSVFSRSSQRIPDGLRVPSRLPWMHFAAVFPSESHLAGLPTIAAY
ncbi:hypothetical protein C8F01DRAFT_1084464 [Mycena amicta]|nr:hypothetical protein C8F01DRAFT_1084464 [Mycena amicta]